MTTAALLRNELFKAKVYMEKKEAVGDDVRKQPNLTPKLELLIPVLKKEIPLKAHAISGEHIFTYSLAQKSLADITLALRDGGTSSDSRMSWLGRGKVIWQ